MPVIGGLSVVQNLAQFAKHPHHVLTDRINAGRLSDCVLVKPARGSSGVCVKTLWRRFI